MAQKTTITVSFDVEADRDILRWLNRQENRSAAVRDALREHIARGSITLGDVYRAVKDLERKLQAGAILAAVPAYPEDEIEEDPEAAAALDRLAEM
jgi:beta-glucosidase/6-phospho-beta-glucosidase/beta-galactosidase